MISSTTPAPLAAHCRKWTLMAASFALVGVLGLGVVPALHAEPDETPQLRLDRFGDSLPPGAIRRFGTLRFRHGSIDNLAFTPDSKQLIAGARGGPLVVFHADSGQKLHELGENSPQFRDLRGFAISPDGERIACCAPHVIFVWDLQSERLIRQLYRPRCQEVAFSPDGTKVAAIEESHSGNGELKKTVVVLEAVAEDPPLKIVAEKTIKEGKQLTFGFNGIAYSLDGRFLAGKFGELYKEKPSVYGISSSQIWLLDAATAARVRTIGPSGAVVAGYAFQPGSGRLATYGKDGIIRFWDTATGKEVQHFQAAKGKEENGFSRLCFSADGRRCAVRTDRAKFLTVLDTKDGRVIRRIEGEESSFRVALALSGDGKTVASARLYDEACVRVWDVETGVERLAGAGHHAAATRLSLFADGRKLISRTDKGEAIHWDLQTAKGEVRPSTDRQEIGQLIWSLYFDRKTLYGPRWRMVYKNQEPPILEIWSLDSAKLIRSLELPISQVPAVAVSPDGRQLAIAGRHGRDAHSTVMLWEPEREEKPRALPGNPQYCRELLFSRDGKRLVAQSGPMYGRGDATGVWWIWDTTQARLVRNLTGKGSPSRMLVTADGRVLLAGTVGKDATVHVWNMETGAQLARMVDSALSPTTKEDQPRFQPAIVGLAQSEDERFVAVASSCEGSSAVSIWETGSWKLVRAFAPTSPRNDVRAMVFSRDSRSLFAANSDTTILEWDISDRLTNGRREPVAENPNRDRLNVLWRMLAETPDKAYPAAWEMLDHPAEALPFLIAKVSPVPPVEEKKVRQLLAQLDSDSFSEREEAGRQLLARGEDFLPMMRQALNDRPTLEMKKRLERILESLSRAPTAEQLRLLRVLAVLEWSNRPEAIEHLRRLAGGAATASFTHAAKAALQRHR